MSELKEFYSELYTERESNEKAADGFLNNSDIPQLDEIANKVCEGL